MERGEKHSGTLAVARCLNVYTMPLLFTVSSALHPTFLTLNDFILKKGFKRLELSCFFSNTFFMLKPERTFKKLLQFPKMCHPEPWLCGEPVGGTGSEGPFSHELGHAVLGKNEAVILPTKACSRAARPPEGLCSPERAVSGSTLLTKLEEAVPAGGPWVPSGLTAEHCHGAGHEKETTGQSAQPCESVPLPGNSGGLGQDPAGTGRGMGAASRHTGTCSSSRMPSQEAGAAATAGRAAGPPGLSWWTRQRRWRTEAAGTAAADPRQQELGSRAGLGLEAVPALGDSLGLKAPEALLWAPAEQAVAVPAPAGLSLHGADPEPLSSPADRNGLGCSPQAQAVDDWQWSADQRPGHPHGPGCTFLQDFPKSYRT